MISIRRRAGMLAVAAALVLGLPAGAAAHVLKVDGDIGAVLHINPDDNPVTGSSTDYVVSFDDAAGRFSLPACDCKVAIIGSDGKTVATRPLAVTGGAVSENRYTFTKPGVYTMHFTGVPKKAGAFQPFRLDYEVRVTDGRAGTQPMPALLWIGMALAVGLILLAAFTMDYDGDDRKGRA